MRAGLWLPTCILISALIHGVLLTAVAVPRKHATAHGETVTVDLIPPEEVPESVRKEMEQEAAPPAPEQQPSLPRLQPQADTASSRPPEPIQPPQQQAQAQKPTPQAQRQQPQQQSQQPQPQ